MPGCGVRGRGVGQLCLSRQLLYKSSAVVEMGDRLATIGMDRLTEKWGAAIPFSVRELGSYLTQCRLGRALPPYQVAS